MADKSQKPNTKKPGKSLKEKRLEKHHETRGETPRL